ncbi:MAG: hypothetical protein ACK5LC_02420 [Coprobacillaceae bacterium]
MLYNAKEEIQELNKTIDTMNKTMKLNMSKKLNRELLNTFTYLIKYRLRRIETSIIHSEHYEKKRVD